MIKKFLLKNHFGQQVSVWFFIDRVRTFNEEMEIVEHNKYVVYFKFQRPSLTILGELLQDSKGKVLVFNNTNSAMDACKRHLRRVWDLESES